MNTSTIPISWNLTVHSTASTTLLHILNTSIPNDRITTVQQSSYEKNKVLFWCFAFVCLCISIITIIGNGIVFVVSHQSRNTTRLRHLDGVVKSLAVTDFLFGLLGTPMIAINYYLSK